MPTTLPLYLKWNNLLSFDREQLIFTYVVGRVQPPNISKDELNPSKKYIYINIIGYHNCIMILIKNEDLAETSTQLKALLTFGVE